jgi:3-carboxy-cis,cis-muconate cycloisomerase
MPARLIDSLNTTGPLADIFSDASLLQSMLDFEAALSRAESREGVVPSETAKAITAAAKAENFDMAAIVRETERAGTPGIAVSKALTARVRAHNAEAARFVHWCATSQDVADTGLVLLLKRARPIVDADLSRIEKNLTTLSEKHRDTVMLGRTLLQAAPPVTLGLKAAGWLAAIRRSRARFGTAFEEALVLQFGGASGTLAALGDKGLAVGHAMAADLGLGFPDAPWHTQRDRLGALVAACGVLTASLGKMARDISLLMQSEVEEVSEPGGDGRGGSSAMPQKQNPIACALALAAAHRVPGLVAAFLSGMVQEHERGVGGWQAEWPTVAEVVQSTGSAAAAMAEAAQGLHISAERMRENLDETHGAIFAERAVVLLGAKLGREAAHKLVGEAARKSAEQGRGLTDVLREMPEVTKVLSVATLDELELPEHYLGVAEALRKRLLGT